ncbi:S-adenosyl-L-methionine-dependent methyltransferase [Nemania sp. NC0429]|nr:S-adenosyl-L-methionine-dependent methyltransferase [Nemania sp. NC0429]
MDGEQKRHESTEEGGRGEGPEPEATATATINPNPRLQSYYASLESVLGYDLLLGGTRHFGYYEDAAAYNPFPLSGALRRMEEELFRALRLPRRSGGARVLDAGCGYGHVARYMARKGLRVTGIDVVERHLRKARETAAKEMEAGRNGKGRGKGEAEAEGEAEGEGEVGSMEIRHMDYHHLEGLADESFDAVYTMETFVHATDPEGVLRGFFRVLKPGGRIAMHEYDHMLEEVEAEGENKDKKKEKGNKKGEEKKEGGKKDKEKKTPGRDLQRAMRQVNEWSAMPTNAISSPGAFKRMLEGAGFVDVEVRDLSAHIRPMTRLFYVLAIVPFYVISLLRLERYFVNTVAGVGAYRGYGFWRYVQVRARKPGGEEEEGVGRREGE